MELRMAPLPHQAGEPEPSGPSRPRRGSPSRAGREAGVKRGTSPPPPAAGTGEETGYEALARQARRANRADSEAEADLLAAAGTGDQEARDSVVNAHLDWVVGAAEERAGRGLSQADLFQEGSLALVKAVGEFHGSGRSDFEAFAREQVAEQMEQALTAEGRAQEDGRKLVEAAEDYERAEQNLRRELGRDATPEELAAKLEWSADRTAGIAELVAEARRRHDEELLTYLDPEDVDLERLLDERREPADDQKAAGGGNGRLKERGGRRGPRGG